MPGVLILDELQSATEGGGIKLAAPLQTQDGADLLSPTGQVSVNFDNVANNSIHMNKLIVPDDIMSGDKIHGGVISGFASEGITDNSSNTVVTIHSNENVGVGTNTPENKLHIIGTIQSDWENATSRIPQLFLKRIMNGVFDGTSLTIDVGMGTGLTNIVGGASLDTSGTSYNYNGTRGASRIGLFDGSITLFTSNTSSGTANTAVTWTECLYASSTGDIGIGTSAPTEKLEVAGNITATGDVTSTSDVRVKTDIKPITGALDIVNKLEGKRFNKFNKPGIGFIAQELEQYMPELVHTANDEMGTKSVNYQNMVALLVEAIKEQQITINKLESKLNGN